MRINYHENLEPRFFLSLLFIKYKKAEKEITKHHKYIRELGDENPIVINLNRQLSCFLSLVILRREKDAGIKTLLKNKQKFEKFLMISFLSVI
jgi:hypothetical protein